MERLATRSSATPCALTATLIAPKPAPKPKSAAERPTSPVESDAAKSEPPPRRSPASVMLRLPTRSHRRPATGIATSAPSEAANSASPSRAVVRPAWCCTAGIRPAQEPIISPSPKKKSPIARRVARIARHASITRTPSER